MPVRILRWCPWPLSPTAIPYIVPSPWVQTGFLTYDKPTEYGKDDANLLIIMLWLCLVIKDSILLNLNERNSLAGLWQKWAAIMWERYVAKNCRLHLGAESNPGLKSSKESGTPIIELQGNHFCQSPEWVWKQVLSYSRLQVRMPPSQ